MNPMTPIRNPDGSHLYLPARICGQEIEYGIVIEGRDLKQLIDDSADFISACPEECFVGWDQEQESSRVDLRGFEVERLEIDPNDQQHGFGQKYSNVSSQRADRILSNGARFYNDHGHPEYATPECFSAWECALQSLAGEYITWKTARAYENSIDRKVEIYRNNTDFHGSPYGTHESFLTPRNVGWEVVMKHLVPVLISRQVVCGAGKVGGENKRDPVQFQISQRADFFEDLASVNTLWRRPVFNTRDEPHAERNDWMRIHVITPDANRIALAQMRGAWLVQIALRLVEAKCCPFWAVDNASKAFRDVSRGQNANFEFGVNNGQAVSALTIIEAIVRAAMSELQLAAQDQEIGEGILAIIEKLRLEDSSAAKELDWMAKRNLIQHYLDAEGGPWAEEFCQSLDLEYSKVDPESGLFQHLQEIGWVIPNPTWDEILPRMTHSFEPTRALVRGHAIKKFSNKIVTAGWERIIFEIENKKKILHLLPNVVYDNNILLATNVEEFITLVEQNNARTTR